MRKDRRYCESKFFRTRVVPDRPAFTSAETCRAQLEIRNATCYMECGAQLTPNKKWLQLVAH